tara:strand:+ start:5215 stop:5373 length:159 start_codon:yes stop_codon:yes gene_type:complete
MDGFAPVLGFLIALLLVLLVVAWLLYAIGLFSFIIGVVGGLYEQITKKKGIF